MNLSTVKKSVANIREYLAQEGVTVEGLDIEDSLATLDAHLDTMGKYGKKCPHCGAEAGSPCTFTADEAKMMQGLGATVEAGQERPQPHEGRGRTRAGSGSSGDRKAPPWAAPTSAARLVACPKCDAAPDKKCDGPSGHVREHRARLDEAAAMLKAAGISKDPKEALTEDEAAAVKKAIADAVAAE